MHGVEVQDEHLIRTPNGWANKKGELGYLIIPMQYCVDHLELIKFYYNNSKHSTTRATLF
jgi:hypothetical protein